jgi:hypothetical protein
MNTTMQNILIALAAYAGSLALSPLLAAEPANAGSATGNPQRKAPPPLTPGGKWRAHDTNRPQPVVVLPPTVSIPEQTGQPPSDAIVLFDGRDLSQWRRQIPKNDPNPADTTPKWKVENGYMEIAPKSGTLFTTNKFSNCQIHVEWATPAEVKGNSQGRGNSGFILQGHPEIQVLDSYQNFTYADGSAAALYGQYPPLVNASRKPGEWQSYDLIYVAPRFDEEKKLVKPALFTVFHNGILVHHAVEVPGTAVECPIILQDHNNPVRYRNLWVRKLKGYDEQ